MDELFGTFFDFDDDGEIDDFEQTTELATFASMIEDEEEGEMLELSSLELDDFDLMDEDERRDALEDAGLYLDDFDL